VLDHSSDAGNHHKGASEETEAKIYLDPWFIFVGYNVGASEEISGEANGSR
jgi:hypothetical protein